MFKKTFGGKCRIGFDKGASISKTILVNKGECLENQNPQETSGFEWQPALPTQLASSSNPHSSSYLAALLFRPNWHPIPISILHHA